MGMAASQARFLSLTARKSNTEYQGQQVNQQRTNLANESANLYNQLANLEVPTAPSVYDYYTSAYSINGEDGYLINGVSSKTANGTYMVDISYVVQEDVVKSIATQAETIKGIKVPTTTVGEDGTPITTNSYYISLGNAQYPVESLDMTKETDKAMAKTLRANKEYSNSAFFAEKLEDGSQNNIYRYKDESGQEYYTSDAMLKYYNEKNDGTVRSIPKFYTVLSDVTKNEKLEALIKKDKSGMWTSITFVDIDNAGGLEPKEYGLTVTKTKDEDAYEAAMNQYEYDKYQYEQKCNQLEAAREEIQAKDKTLELQLKQLDTEQQALSTELEAVQNVIKKNVENTFNTFKA